MALESTPSAGFAWSVEQLDPALVRAAGRTVTVVEQAFGSPALETWCFTALAVGDTPLVLRYHRAAQPAIPPVRHFTLTVRVR